MLVAGCGGAQRREQLGSQNAWRTAMLTGWFLRLLVQDRVASATDVALLVGENKA
jgi:hypothetical protein